MAVSPSVPVPPEELPHEREHRRQLARGISSALGGKLNNVGAVTLTASGTTTAIADARLTVSSVILLMPLTANASTAEKAGIWTSARSRGSLTLTHASAVAVDQRFSFVIFG